MTQDTVPTKSARLWESRFDESR